MSDGQSSGVFRTSISPWLSVTGSKRAVAFYKEAFGASEAFLLDGGEKGIVARLTVMGAEFWLAEASPEHGNVSPESLQGTSVRMILIVEDPDAVFAQALAAGATQVCPVSEDHGWRVGRVVDPFGHHWEIGRKLA